MKRAVIDAPDELLERLHQLAAERGIAVSALILEALEEKADRARPKPRSLGIGASEFSDTARRTGDERPVPRSWR